MTTINIPWEPLGPGPVGEYLEVVDVDPASQLAYAPIPLDDPALLHEHGLEPSETDPRFHQQMVYAVASRAIEHFERALGRRALWAPHREPHSTAMRGEFTQRLRIYPHGLRTSNAFYSPQKKALLLGYFQSQVATGREDNGRPMIFSALSHDIVAHETTHALLDGLHRRFIEATNPDCLAFHEAFADIVAMFLHFTMPDAVRPEIAATRGDLFKNNRLGQLAFRFGQSIGHRGALRDYIGSYDSSGTWQPCVPSVDDYGAAIEPHDRGAVLVSAVFDAFLRIYEVRAQMLFELASRGSGIVEPGELAPALVNALTVQVCRLAGSFLNILIRGLDYCPPFDITFGEYLRAIITADHDLVPDDPEGFRVALAAAFRARGISPPGVRSVSPDTLAWESPEASADALDLNGLLNLLKLDWPSRTSRRESFDLSNANAATLHGWLVDETQASDEQLAVFGIERHVQPLAMKFNDAEGNSQVKQGNLRGPEVHSVRTLRRVGPDGTTRADLIVEITQSWVPVDPTDGTKFRGGCTLIIDRTTGMLNYVIRKRVTHDQRYAAQRAFLSRTSTGARAAYFTREAASGEPFAILHSCLSE